MADITGNLESGVGAGSRRDAIVLGAMTLVAAAIGMAAHLHADLPLPIVAMTSIALLVLLVSLHLLVAGDRRPRRATHGASRSRSTSGRVRRGDRAEPVRMPPSEAIGMAALGSMAPSPMAIAERGAVPTVEAPATGRGAASEVPLVPTPELITEMIRELAAEVRNGEGAGDASGTPRSLSPSLQPGAPGSGDDRAYGRAARSGDPGAVDALGTALPHDLAHAADAGGTTPHADPIGSPQPASQASILHRKLAEIADALERERLEVALSPILAIGSSDPHHYEVVVRLRLGSGEALVPSGIDPVARGTSLLPLLEALKVARSLKIGRELAARGTPGALLSTVSADALMSERIVQSLAGLDAPQPAATRIVLSFAQNEVRLFGQAQWSTLADLADLGFRFAIEQIVDLDMDFEQLRNVGFVFTKIDAGVLLDGLPAAGAPVPAADLCRYFAQLGLAIVVARVDDQTLLARIQATGAMFAQGAIFGPDQLVDPMEQMSPVAA